MAVSDYSTTPASNSSISGINIAENCSPGGLNDAFRQLMADVKVFYDGVPSASTFMTVEGGTFSGTQPKYTGRGAYAHHNNSANTSARIFIQASGGAIPSMSNGDMLFEY